MVGDVPDRGAPEVCRDVVPACLRARGMVARVIAVAVLRGHVDSTDEGDPVVDHDRLLVMAVHGPFSGVERAADACFRERLPDLAHVPPGRPEQWKRRTGPQEYAHVDAVGELREEVAEDSRLALSREGEIGRYVPAGQINVRLRRA